MKLNRSSLHKAELAKFLPNPRAIADFDDIQSDVTDIGDGVTTATFLTVNSEPSLGAERIFTPLPGELVGTDTGANSPYTLGLADTAVAPGGYGDAAHLVKLTFDAKGRATAAQGYVLNSDNVTEGATNLFFTQARARSSLSATSGISYDSTTGIITAAPAGIYGAPTGTLSRSTFAAYTAGATLTFSAGYVQAELTATATRLAAIEAALQAQSRVLAALVTDLKANGNLG